MNDLRTFNPRLASGELSRISPGGVWPGGPAMQTQRTIDPRLATGELSRIQQGMSWPQRQGTWPSSSGGTQVLEAGRPIGAAAQATSPGLMSRMLGLGGRVVGRVLGPVGAAMTAYDAIDAAGQSMPGQMMGAMSPDGFASSIMDVVDEAAMAQPPVMPAAPAAPYQPAWAPAPRMVPMSNTRVPPASLPPRYQGMAAIPAPATMGVREGMNTNIGDDVRQRAMQWLALNQGGN